MPDVIAEFGAAEQLKEASPAILVDARGEDPGTGDTKRLHVWLLVGCAGSQYRGSAASGAGGPLSPTVNTRMLLHGTETTC